MDFGELVKRARDKKIGQNSVSDYVLFTMLDKNGNKREVMKSEVDNYFQKRGRKTADDREIFRGYQDYLIDHTHFTVADLKTNNLGFVRYKNGEKWPVVVEIDDYRFTESAISYYSTFKVRTAKQEIAVMVGKALDMVPLEDNETIASIKKRLKMD